MGTDPQSIEAQLAVISTKLDLLITTRDDHETRLRGVEDRAPTQADRIDVEGRLRKLEQFRWIVVGVSAAAGAVGGNLAPLLKG